MYISIADILTITSEAPEALVKRMLNEKDGEGQSPLQLASAADKTDVVLAMMAAGTIFLSSSDTVSEMYCRPVNKGPDPES